MALLRVFVLSALYFPSNADFLSQYPDGELVRQPPTQQGPHGGNITVTVEQHSFFDLKCSGQGKGTYTGVAGECNKFVVGHFTAYWTFTMTTCDVDGSISIYSDSKCGHAMKSLPWKASDYGKCIGTAVSTCQALDASASYIPSMLEVLSQHPDGEMVRQPPTQQGPHGGNIAITVEQYSFLDLKCSGESKATYTGIAGECNKFVVGPFTAYWTFTMTTCDVDGSISIYSDSKCGHAMISLPWQASDYGKCIGSAVSTCQALEASVTTLLV